MYFKKKKTDDSFLEQTDEVWQAANFEKLNLCCSFFCPASIHADAAGPIVGPGQEEPAVDQTERAGGRGGGGRESDSSDFRRDVRWQMDCLTNTASWKFAEMVTKNKNRRDDPERKTAAS